MLPSTWLVRTLRYELCAASGLAVEGTGLLLDTYPSGPIIAVNGGKMLISWDRIAFLELVED